MAKPTVTASAVSEVVPSKPSAKKYIKLIPNTVSLKGIEVTEESFDLPKLDEKQALALKNAIECGIIKEA